jgi:hypothetical protein
LFVNDLINYVLIALLLAGFLLFTAFSVEKIFILLAFYVSSFEVRGYLIYFPGISIWYSWKASYPLFGLLILYWIVYLTRNKEHFIFNQMDKAVLVYLVVMFLGAFNGFFRGYDRMLVLYDFVSVPFFFGYFIFLYSPMKEKIGMFYDFLLSFAVFVGFQFIYAVTKFQTGFFLTRIVSEHIHIALFAAPYATATLIFSTSRARKIISAIALPILITGVILCQQRSLYATTGLTMILLFGLYAYRRRAYIKTHIRQFVRYTFLALALIIAIFLIAQSLSGGKFLTTISSRLFIFLNIGELNRDISWQIRWNEIDDALHGLGHFWLFGKGFGASFITRFRYMLTLTVDQSYVYLIWKTGIIGLFTFLYLYFVFLKRGITTLLKRISDQDRIFLLAALLNIGGMMIVALANVSLPHYRLMFVWAGLFAATEAIARKYD